MPRNLLKTLLKLCTIRILKKYHPEVIGITGSVGKTSTKEAIYACLASHFPTRKSEGNYNTEIGVPLTIIGSRQPRSVVGWFGVFSHALSLLLMRNKKYPEILILEMAADGPGDIQYLVKLAKPTIGVVTSIGISHLEAFSSIDRVAREKGELVATLPRQGYAVLNFDDERTRTLAERTKARVTTFGFRDGAMIRGLEFALEQKLTEWTDTAHEVGGTHAKVQYEGNTVPLYLPNVLGKTHIYAALAAIAVGSIKGLNLVKIIESLKGYVSPPGRLKIISGIKRTYLIDDSYNAAPASMKAALELLRDIKLLEASKRYAVLGDMFELGHETENAHYEVGKYVAEMGIDELVVVGERSAKIIAGAKDGGIAENHLYHFGTTEEAGKFVQDRIKSGDLILIKASRAMHFEKIVKELMAEPLKAQELLVH